MIELETMLEVIQAGGKGSGWFANAGHIKHTIATSQNILKKAGWEGSKSPNEFAHDKLVHPYKTGHKIYTFKTGQWKHYDEHDDLVNQGNTSKGLKVHLANLGQSTTKIKGPVSKPSSSYKPSDLPKPSYTPKPSKASTLSDPKYNTQWQTGVHQLAAQLVSDPNTNKNYDLNDPNSIYTKMATQLDVPPSKMGEMVDAFNEMHSDGMKDNPLADWMQQVVNKEAGMHPGVAIEHAIAQASLKERAANGVNTDTGGVPDLHRGLKGEDQVTSGSLEANVYMLRQIAKANSKMETPYSLPFKSFGGEGFSGSYDIAKDHFSNDTGVIISKPAGTIDPWNVVSARDLSPAMWKKSNGEQEWAIAPKNRYMYIDNSKGDKLTIKAEVETEEDPDATVEDWLELLQSHGWDHSYENGQLVMYWPEWLKFNSWDASKPVAAGPTKAQDISAECISCESGDCIVHAGGEGSGWFREGGHVGHGDTNTPLRRFSSHDNTEDRKINGIPLKKIENPDFAAQMNPKIYAPPLPKLPLGKHMAAGLIIVEPGGKDVWTVTPKDYYGGYRNTFPKGTVDPGESPQHAAIRETFEESGLLAKPTAYLGDVERSTSITRYFVAERVGGSPAAAGPETHTVKLMDIHDPATAERLNDTHDQPTADHKVLQMLQDHIAGKVVEPPKVEAPIAEKPKIEQPKEPTAGEPQNISTWTKTGGAMGSNPGGVYTGDDGKSYYVKFPQKDPVQAKSELLADKIYNALGIPAKEGKLVTNDKGQLGLASELLPGAQGTTKAQQAQSSDVRKGFVADAYLANWDVFGLVNDNITRADGKDYRIDNGGTMFHRAQGAAKDFPTDKVGELTTLVTGGGQGKGIYHDLTDAEKKTQAQHLVDTMTPAKVINTVASAGFKGAEAVKYVKALNGRRDVIAQTFGIKIKAEIDLSAGFETVAKFVFQATTTTYMLPSMAKEASEYEEKLKKDPPYNRADYPIDEDLEKSNEGLSSKLGTKSPIEGACETLASFIEDVLAGGPGSGRKKLSLSPQEKVAQILKKPWHKQSDEEKTYVAFHDPRQRKLFKHVAAMIEALLAGGPGSGRHKEMAQTLLKQHMGNTTGAWNYANKLMKLSAKPNQKDYWRQVRDHIPLSDKAKLQQKIKESVGPGEQVGIQVKPTKSMKPKELPPSTAPIPSSPAMSSYLERMKQLSQIKPAEKTDEEGKPKEAELSQYQKALFDKGKKKTVKAGGPGSGRHPYGRKAKPQSVLSKGKMKTVKEKPLSDKQKKGLKSKWHKIGATEQQYAEAQEQKLAKGIKGKSYKDSEPVDIIVRNAGRLIGLEMKTLLVQKDKIRKSGTNEGPKLTMNKKAVAKKYDWAATTKGELYTLALDHRPFSKDYGAIYMRQGAGSWNTITMTKVGNSFKDVATYLKLKTGAHELPLPQNFPRTKEDFGVPAGHKWTKAPKGIK